MFKYVSALWDLPHTTSDAATEHITKRRKTLPRVGRKHIAQPETPLKMVGCSPGMIWRENPEDSHTPAVDVILVIAAVKEVCHTLFTAEGTGEWLFIDEQISYQSCYSW